jgi:hypothetical protein
MNINYFDLSEPNVYFLCVLLHYIKVDDRIMFSNACIALNCSIFCNYLLNQANRIEKFEL